jgi:hypothetical protein
VTNMAISSINAIAPPGGHWAAIINMRPYDTSPGTGVLRSTRVA